MCKSRPEVCRSGDERARNALPYPGAMKAARSRGTEQASTDPRDERLALTADEVLRDRAREVRAWLDDRAEEMAALLESLVAIDSENPPGRALGRCGRCSGTRSRVWICQPS